MSTGTGPLSSDPDIVRLRRLAEIGRALTYTTTLDEVARLVVERAADLLAASSAILMLADSDGLLHVRAAHGVSEDRLARFRAPSSDEMFDRLGGLLCVSDDCFVAVPLVVGGAVTGVVGVALTRASTSVDEWLLSALADQVSVAIDNARLGGEVRLEMEGRLRASEGATSAKDRALSTLAHDIRTPLGAIDGYCSNIEDEVFGPVNDRQREALARVRMSGRHLLSLLENVLDMARLDAGVVRVKAEPVRLSEVAREAVDMLAPAAGAKLQRLELNADSDVVVTGDAARIRQIVINLLGNAVKFTPQEGSIDVCTVERVVDGATWGEIRVTDTGPGIGLAEQSAVFDPYYRSEATAMSPGVGLGLAISRGLVKEMNGELELDSAVGIGSTFAVRFPTRSPSSP